MSHLDASPRRWCPALAQAWLGVALALALLAGAPLPAQAEEGAAPDAEAPAATDASAQAEPAEAASQAEPAADTEAGAAADAAPTTAAGEGAGEGAAGRALSPVTRGMGDFLSMLQSTIDARGQDILAEKALEHARRNDEVSEKLRLDALNARGDEYTRSIDAAARLLEGTATAEELAEEEAQRAAAEAASDEGDATPSSPSSADKPAADRPQPRTNTIRFHDEYIAFEQGSPADETAPASIAAAWVSNGDVDDDENTYFIGHNPGVFSGVMDLGLGDKITVWDGAGRSRDYYVFDVLTLPNHSNYFRYEGRIAPTGESITLQTCCADDKNVRCVMAR